MSVVSHYQEDTVWTCVAVLWVLPGASIVRSVPKRAHLSSEQSVPEGPALLTEEIFWPAGRSIKVLWFWTYWICLLGVCMFFMCMRRNSCFLPPSKKKEIIACKVNWWFQIDPRSKCVCMVVCLINHGVCPVMHWWPSHGEWGTWCTLPVTLNWWMDRLMP